MQKRSKFLFIVQGEGRGHMTQAISLKETLTEAGHEVCCVLVGKSDRRIIPDFFFDRIGVPVHTFESPNFVMDNKNKSIKLLPTITYNLQKASFFLQNLGMIDKKVKEFDPDVIINFYDLLAGLYNRIYNPRAKFICIGHQYLLLHPKFDFPKGKLLERLLIQWNTHITSFNAHKRLALSFSHLPVHSKHQISVVPPLLRKEVVKLIPESKPYYLVYLLNDGYADEILEWHKVNSDVILHCFWDRRGVEDEYKVHENLTFHKISDHKFLSLMSGCAGFISTAGFESICEAMYLGKPIMMVPTNGHFEQECNAHDAVKVKAGISCSKFDLTQFLNYLPIHNGEYNSYKNWVNQATSLFLKELAS